MSRPTAEEVAARAVEATRIYNSSQPTAYEAAKRIKWFKGLGVRADGTIDRYERKDGTLQKVEDDE
jgi:hypothetical protein